MLFGGFFLTTIVSCTGGPQIMTITDPRILASKTIITTSWIVLTLFYKSFILLSGRGNVCVIDWVGFIYFRSDCMIWMGSSENISQELSGIARKSDQICTRALDVSI